MRSFATVSTLMPSPSTTLTLCARLNEPFGLHIYEKGLARGYDLSTQNPRYQVVYDRWWDKFQTIRNQRGPTVVYHVDERHPDRTDMCPAVEIVRGDVRAIWNVDDDGRVCMAVHSGDAEQQLLRRRRTELPTLPEHKMSDADYELLVGIITRRNSFLDAQRTIIQSESPCAWAELVGGMSPSLPFECWVALWKTIRKEIHEGVELPDLEVFARLRCFTVFAWRDNLLRAVYNKFRWADTTRSWVQRTPRR